jgi:hypothetical protein
LRVLQFWKIEVSARGATRTRAIRVVADRTLVRFSAFVSQFHVSINNKKYI